VQLLLGQLHVGYMRCAVQVHHLVLCASMYTWICYANDIWHIYSLLYYSSADRSTAAVAE
jgi:hypothetical protein